MVRAKSYYSHRKVKFNILQQWWKCSMMKGKVKEGNHLNTLWKNCRFVHPNVWTGVCIAMMVNSLVWRSFSPWEFPPNICGENMFWIFKFSSSEVGMRGPSMLNFINSFKDVDLAVHQSFGPKAHKLLEGDYYHLCRNIKVQCA